MKKTAIALAVMSAMTFGVANADFTPETKPATETTIKFQEELRQSLPFNNVDDIELAKKGFIARPDRLVIKNAEGKVAWELGGYDFLLEGKDFDSIHPSLQRQATLNMNYGLYEVRDGVYQVRGYDLANITFIKGVTGWIIFDPLTVPETSRAALDFINAELGERPVKAVVYSHAHGDHFGGVRGVANQEDVDSGETQIIAPRAFMDVAISENVLAGNAMARRVTYQYGSVLPKNETGVVDAAIGKGLSSGAITLIVPTKVIEEDQETLEIDGVKMVFQNTPNTESPAEMNTYFPELKTLWMGENTVGGLHNVYTMRGAEVRDTKAWADYINKALDQFGGDAEVLMASHSWPRWGNEALTDYLKKQRDMYGFLNDETLRLLNNGVTFDEMQDEFKVPPALAQEWYNRGYHGSYHRNAKAVVNKYIGYFDMNPATLIEESPVESAPKFVEAMGGLENVLSIGKKAFDKGDYRWAAELVNKAVYAYPENDQARFLQADILEQLGYQAESAGERNVFLSGAKELRDGVVQTASVKAMSPDMIYGMRVVDILDFLAVRLDGYKAAETGLEFSLNFRLPDVDQKYLVELSNGRLNNLEGAEADKADIELVINRADLNKVMLKQTTLKNLIGEGKATLTGETEKLTAMSSMLDTFNPWYNIVTPNDHSGYSHGMSKKGVSPINR